MSEADTSAVRAAVDDFPTAFDNLDWERFRRCFASDATVFFPWDLHPRRTDGKREVEAEFKRFFDQVRTRAAGPPYLNLVPLDMAIQVWQDAAPVTFHLDRPPAIGRRTLVLQRQAQEWRMVHPHASSITAPNTQGAHWGWGHFIPSRHAPTLRQGYLTGSGRPSGLQPEREHFSFVRTPRAIWPNLGYTYR